MKEGKYFTYLYILALFIICLVLIFAFNMPQKVVYELNNSGVDIFWSILLILFVFFSDNIRIPFRNTVLVSNYISIITLILWIGPYSALLFTTLTLLFRIKLVKTYKLPVLPTLSNRFSTYFLMIFCAMQVFKVETLSIEWKFFLFIIIMEMVNIILVQLIYPIIVRKKMNFGMENVYSSLLEVLFPIILIPFSGTIYKLSLIDYYGTKAFFYIYPLMLMTYFLSVRFYTKVFIEKEEKKRLSKFKNGLESVLSTLKLIRSTEDTKEILTKAIALLSQALEYKCALVSLVYRETMTVERIANYGFSDEEFQKIKDRKISFSMIRNFFDQDFYFGGAYFIPKESNLINNMEAGITTSIAENDLKNSSEKKDTWKDDDLFIVPFTDDNGMIMGYISLDIPLNGKRPTIEEAEIAKIFAEQIGRIVEASNKYKEVIEKTQKDQMTGLYNHSYFYEILDSNLKDLGPDETLSIIMLDLDNFKRLNDTYGHIMGDSVLIMVSNIIKIHLKEDYFAARYGGEEFIIILKNTTKMQALELANTIIKKISVNSISGIYVTASGGVSSAPEDGNTSSVLVSAADMALYTAKKSGKNQIIAA